MNEMTATELKARLDAGDDIQLIDVRQPDEYQFAHIEGATLIPMGEIPTRIDELDPSKEIVFHCHMGGRSARVIQFLEQQGFTGKMYNLVGGIGAWSSEVDPTVPRY